MVRMRNQKNMTEELSVCMNEILGKKSDWESSFSFIKHIFYPNLVTTKHHIDAIAVTVAISHDGIDRFCKVKEAGAGG